MKSGIVFHKLMDASAPVLLRCRLCLLENGIPTHTLARQLDPARSNGHFSQKHGFVPMTFPLVASMKLIIYTRQITLMAWILAVSIKSVCKQFFDVTNISSCNSERAFFSSFNLAGPRLTGLAARKWLNRSQLGE